ncbi:hypothetical protein L1887_52620 [Cichorium endivia]|nr:hypothetical protein L1887_52620 [Cichorium endivia]
MSTPCTPPPDTTERDRQHRSTHSTARRIHLPRNRDLHYPTSPQHQQHHLMYPESRVRPVPDLVPLQEELQVEPFARHHFTDYPLPLPLPQVATAFFGPRHAIYLALMLFVSSASASQILIFVFVAAPPPPPPPARFNPHAFAHQTPLSDCDMHRGRRKPPCVVKVRKDAATPSSSAPGSSACIKPRAQHGVVSES